MDNSAAKLLASTSTRLRDLADLSAVEHTEMNPKSANAMMAEATATSMSVKASLDCPGPADWTG
jgi:hypothetical protein